MQHEEGRGRRSPVPFRLGWGSAPVPARGYNPCDRIEYLRPTTLRCSDSWNVDARICVAPKGELWTGSRLNAEAGT